MPLIRLDNISIAFGTRALLDQVCFQIDPGERVALVGLNGAGKSTLLKLIGGQLQADGGEFWVDPSCRVAELPQALPAADERGVRDVVMSGLGEVVEMRQRYEELVMEHDERTMAKLDVLQQQIEAVDGWHLEQKVQRVMERLGLPEDRLMSELSGGWRRRAALGAALVQEPDLLLLDEPTNHLDIETIEWIEQQMKDFRGGLLFISHDRSLVESLATRIVEIDRGKLVSFPGSYSQYKVRKEQMLNEEARHNAEFDKKLAQEEVWIRQGVKARRTRNEGRVRALEALRSERSERRNRQGSAKFGLETAQRSGKLVAELKDVSLGYDGRTLVDKLSLTINRGDRIGLIGPNGIGKSSLLKLVLGQQAPDSGVVNQGTKVEVAYFDQLRGQLDMEKTVIDNISQGRESISINGKDRHIISYLSDFLFAPERARTPVKALSGGECNRVLLAKLFSQPANVLVLDEPTNDLDVETLELLEEILLEFTGTVLLVSHDRAFLDNVVTSTLVFEGQGRINEYVGGYHDWIRQKPQPVVAQTSKGRVEKPVLGKEGAPKAARKLSYKVQRELDGLPAQLEAAEAKLAELQTAMSDSRFYEQGQDKVQAGLDAFAQQEKVVEVLMERWVELEAMQD